MHFTQLHNKQIYPIWSSQYYQYRIYIKELVVMQVYHFRVVDNGKTIYSSIEHKIYFTEFDEAVKYIEEWVKKNLTNKRTKFNEDQF